MLWVSGSADSPLPHPASPVIPTPTRPHTPEGDGGTLLGLPGEAALNVLTPTPAVSPTLQHKNHGENQITIFVKISRKLTTLQRHIQKRRSRLLRSSWPRGCRSGR